MPNENKDHSYLDEEEVKNAKYSLEAWADKHNVVTPYTYDGKIPLKDLLKKPL